MTVEISYSNMQTSEYGNVWEIYDNPSENGGSVILVNHDHLVLARIGKKEIKHLKVTI